MSQYKRGFYFGVEYLTPQFFSIQQSWNNWIYNYRFNNVSGWLIVVRTPLISWEHGKKVQENIFGIKKTKQTKHSPKQSEQTTKLVLQHLKIRGIDPRIFEIDVTPLRQQTETQPKHSLSHMLISSYV